MSTIFLLPASALLAAAPPCPTKPPSMASARSARRPSSSSSFSSPLSLGITYWAARRTRTTSDFFVAGGSVTAWQNGFALAGDLHERGELPGHRRAGGQERLRRPAVFDGLSRRLAAGAVPDRGEPARHRQIHLRRRGRLPAASRSRCASRRRSARWRWSLLPHRADGRRGQAHPAHVRA